MKKIAVVECVDDKFAANLMCLNSCNSLVKNVNNADFYLLILKTNPFQVFYQKLGFKLIFVDDDFNIFFNNLDSHGWSSFVYTRFLIFRNEVFKQYEYVLYLDTDTFIAHDISDELEKLTSEVNCLGMVRERRAYESGNLFKLRQINSIRNLNYEIGNIYCNAGVILFNSSIFSFENFEKILELLKYHQDFPFNDQDIINMIFGKNITPIDVKYNFFSNTFYDSYFQTLGISPNNDTVSIFHFAGYLDINDKFQHSLQTFYANSRDFLSL